MGYRRRSGAAAGAVGAGLRRRAFGGRRGPRFVGGDGVLKLGIPKGRMYDGVVRLLGDAGLPLRTGARDYRPTLGTGTAFEVKILKPQNIVEMIRVGTRDVGFVGRDWIDELNADVVEVLDTGLDPVRIVAAAPAGFVPPADRPVVVAGEYEQLTRRWLEGRGTSYVFVRSFGATEVFPPEDADMIVDNTATGHTLTANGLAIVGEVMRSSTRLVAARWAYDDADKRRAIDDLVQLLTGVLEARGRVLLEMNVPLDRFDEIVAALPCMREPTVARLHDDAGYAVKVAAPRDVLPALIPKLKRLGAGDILVSRVDQIIP